MLLITTAYSIFRPAPLKDDKFLFKSHVLWFLFHHWLLLIDYNWTALSVQCQLYSSIRVLLCIFCYTTGCIVTYNKWLRDQSGRRRVKEQSNIW